MKPILVSALFAVATAASAFPTAHLGGLPGRKLDALLAERAFSPFARGACYEETVNAFRTHYDDVHPPYEWHAADSGTWQGEYWGKTTIGLVGAARYTGDLALESFIAEKTRAFVKEFQKADGYLSTYADPLFLKPRNGGMNWNLWGMKYTLWGLIEVYDLTGDVFFLDAASKLMDWQIATVKTNKLCLAEQGCFAGLPAMSVLKPLVLLYERTHEKRHLDYAAEIVALMDRKDGTCPNLVANAFDDRYVCDWYPDAQGWAKGYEFLSCLEGLLAYARAVAPGEESSRCFRAVRNVVDKLAADELSALYSVSFFDHFVGASRLVNAETEVCDAIHWARVNYALWDRTDEARYLDAAERVFFNSVLTGVHGDGKWCSNAVRSQGFRRPSAPHEVAMKYHQCCVDNAPRAFFDYAAHALVANRVNFYTPGSYRSDDLEVTIGEGYPFADTVDVRVKRIRPPADAKNPVKLVAFRVPADARHFCVDGVRYVPGAQGYVGVPAPEPGAMRTYRVSFGFKPVVHRGPAVRTLPADKWVRNVWAGWGGEPELRKIYREKPAATVTFGPVLLARGVRTGVAAEQVFAFESIRSQDVDVTVVPSAHPPEGWFRGTLRITTEKGVSRDVPVGDFASVCDISGECPYSIWF